MIFLMITGESPFKNQNQFVTFQNIKDVNYKFPEDIDEHAKDIIDKLL